MSKKIKVEVAYALPDRQQILVLEVDEMANIDEVIHQSGILALFPEIDLTRQKVGVFSKVKSLSDTLREGDRVEIYRPLTIDPKEARVAKVKAARKRAARLYSERKKKLSSDDL